MHIGPYRWGWDRPDLWFRNIWWELSLVPSRAWRVITWIPVLWYIWDFDHGSVTAVMRFQLAKLEKILREADRHVGDQKCAKDIRIVLQYLERQERTDGVVRFYPGGMVRHDYNRDAFQLMGKRLLSWWS